MRIKAIFPKTIRKMNGKSNKKKYIKCIDIYVSGMKPLNLKNRAAVKTYMRKNNLVMMFTTDGVFVNRSAT